MSDWKKVTTFEQDITGIEEHVDYLYMVDSFGGVYPEDVRETVALIRSRSSIRLGFHGHNNLELGLINTLTALDEGVELLDATFTGMGRGAGNLRMELLLTALQSKGLLKLNYDPLSLMVDRFSELQNHYGWGTNLPYMVSGANSLPQKQVMEWVSRRYYSFNSIIRALDNQSQGMYDNIELQNFTAPNTYSKALIVGGGPSAIEHINGIEALINKHPDMCIIHASSKHAQVFNEIKIPQFFCLVGNEGFRLEENFRSVNGTNHTCLLPPYPRKMGTYIPENMKQVARQLPEITVTDRWQDSHTALALETARMLGAEDLYLVGYDGYFGAEIGQKERELLSENDYHFSKLSENDGVRFRSITPTAYEELPVESVYAIISNGDRI